MMMEQLKSATASAHAHTEATLPSLEVLATPRGYRWYVLALHRFHVVWEPAVWSIIGDDVPGLEPVLRQKLPSLARDLASLGLAAPEMQLRPPPAPRFDSVSAALGALYVLEGASLGGRVIARRVASVLGVSSIDGGAYFHGYGDDTGAMWRRFGLIVNAWVSERGGSDAVIQGALDCFGVLETWLGERVAEAGLRDLAVANA